MYRCGVFVPGNLGTADGGPNSASYLPRTGRSKLSFSEPISHLEDSLRSLPEQVERQRLEPVVEMERPPPFLLIRNAGVEDVHHNDRSPYRICRPTTAREAVDREMTSEALAPETTIVTSHRNEFYKVMRLLKNR